MLRSVFMSWTVSSAGGRHLCLQTTQERSTSHCGLPADHPDLSVGFNSSSVAFFSSRCHFQLRWWISSRFSADSSSPACCFWHSLGFFDDTYLQRRWRRVLSRCSRPVFGPVLSQIFLISLSSYCFLAQSFSFSEPNTEILPKINHYCRHQTSNNKLPQIHAGIFQ